MFKENNLSSTLGPHLMNLFTPLCKHIVFKVFSRLNFFSRFKSRFSLVILSNACFICLFSSRRFIVSFYFNCVLNPFSSVIKNQQNHLFNPIHFTITRFKPTQSPSYLRWDITTRGTYFHERFFGKQTYTIKMTKS